MNEIKDGGPAFPLAHSHVDLVNTNWSHANGLSLRDYFAAKAMHAALVTCAGAEDEKQAIELAARIAYLAADSMLRARGAA